MSAGRQEREPYDLLFRDELSSLFTRKPPGGAAETVAGAPHGGLTALPLLTFADVLSAGPTTTTATVDYGGSWPGKELTGDVGNAPPSAGGGATTPATPNYSSMSSSSTEAAGGEGGERCKNKDQEKQKAKGDEEGGDESKKPNTSKNKRGEKRAREARFAFVTKSEVDHLEDGYRWRKYGQKAVKNSPYPRSYYRCTAQRCPVKKRVERSYLNPAIVITTYEGRHGHRCPAAGRGSTHLLPPPPPSSSASFTSHDLVMQQPPGGINPASNPYILQPPPLQQQLLQFQGHGLLQDMLPNSFANTTTQLP